MIGLHLFLKYWKLGLVALLVVAVGVQEYRVVRAKNATLAERSAHLVTISKLREVTAAVEYLAREGERRKAEVERARSIGDEGIKAARSEAARLRNLPANGCRTPEAVMGAGL